MNALHRHRSPSPLRAYLGAVAGAVLGLLASLALDGVLDPAHLMLIVIGAVVAVSAIWGRGPGALSAVLATLGYDFFFLPPRHSLGVSSSHLFSLLLLLAIALAVGQLAARLRRQADVAQVRQAHAQATSQLARELTGAVTSKQAVEITKQRMRDIFGFVPEISLDPSRLEAETDEMVLPLRAPRKVRGTMRLRRSAVQEDDRTLLETFAAVCALSLERIHFVEVAHDAVVRMEGEKMRSHVLSCLSHDLRTPLTGIVAQSGRLAMGLTSGTPHEVAELAELAENLHGEAGRMADLVENLLELARLQSGGVCLRYDWHAAEDLCACALRQRHEFLAGREVLVDIPEGLPLVWCDGVLVERVLVNLLDNAHRHTPLGGSLRLWVAVNGMAKFGLDDQGPGLRLPGSEVDAAESASEIPKRGAESRSGGIGLSLCRAIAQAHLGDLRIEAAPKGARVVLRLPQTQKPPQPPVEEE